MFILWPLISQSYLFNILNNIEASCFSMHLQHILSNSSTLQYLVNRNQNKVMVEVVHRYHESYPFGLDKVSQNTFLMILKENLNEQQISLYRQKCKILKTLSSNTFIKLQKMLKEENTIHLQFQYFPLSLQKYIEAVKNEGHSSRQRCKAIIYDFNISIDSAINQLVQNEIKADVLLSNFAVVLKQKGGILLKVFIEPECEILSLIQHEYKAKESKKKDRTANNQQYLHQFYEAQRKRLNIEFQELLEQYFGKIQQIEKKQMPNFVINGTKLTFIKEENPTKQSKIEQKIQNPKQKMEKKLEQNKKINQQVEQKLQNMTPPLKSRQQQVQVPPPALESKKPKVEKIVNFDQSFEPEFKPEQFTNQNTYILEQNDYLESLEQQLVKLASDKKLTKQHPSKTTHPNQKIKEENTTAEDKKIATDSQKSFESQKQVNKSNSHNNSNSNSNININQNSSNNIKNNLNQNQNNSNTSNHSNQAQCLEICKIEPKNTAIIEQKVFKYKMKIITSHQIQIEGDGQPNVEEIQREIMEGIKTGKLNINDLASQKRPSQNKSEQANTSNQNSKDSKQMSGSTHTQKSANVGNFLKQAKDKIIQSSHEGTKKEVQQPQAQTQILQTRSSDLQQPKMRSINQIIERIGINKANQNHANELKEAKLAAFKQSSSQHHQQVKVPIIQSNTTPHYKSEKIQMAEQKVQKADNYLTKIRQAKEKAQLILKQYTKKKQ